MKRKPHLNARALACSIGLFSPFAWAVTWDGYGSDASWSNQYYWNTHLEPGLSDNVLFPDAIPLGGSIINLSSGELAGLLRLDNDYTLKGGSLTVSTGTIDVETDTLSNPATAKITSALGGSNGLTKSGPGRLILTATPAYSGPTWVANGTLEFNLTSGSIGSGNYVISDTLSVVPSTVLADLSLTAANAIASSAVTFASSARLRLDRNGNHSLTLTLGGAGAPPNAALSRGSNATLEISNASGIANLGSSSGERLFVNGGMQTANGIVQPSIMGVGSAARGDTSLVPDFLNYSSTNGFQRATYAASTDINGGVAGDSRIFNATTAQTLTANSEVFALRAIAPINGNFTLTIGSGGLFTGLGLTSLPNLNFGAEAIVYNAGTLNLPTVSGGSGMTKTGPGNLLITSLGTSGGLNVVEGTVDFSDAAAFGSNTLKLDGGGARCIFGSSATIAKPITLGLKGGTLVSMDPGTPGSVTFSGLISGGNSTPGVPALTVIGSSGSQIQALSTSPNTFTGDVLISGGTLQVPVQGSADPTILGSGAKNIVLKNGGTFWAVANGATNTQNPPPGTKIWEIGSGGGTLKADSSVNFILDDPGQLTGRGTLTKAGPGTLTLGSPSAGQPDFYGAVVVADGTLCVRHPYGLGSVGDVTFADVTLANGRLTLQSDGSGDNGSVYFVTRVRCNSGSGEIYLRRESAAVGNDMHIIGLDLGDTSLHVTGLDGYALSIDGTSTLSGNATLMTSARSVTWNGPIVGAGGLTLSADSPVNGVKFERIASYAGPTVIQSGFLALGQTGDISNSDITIGSDAVFDVTALDVGYTVRTGKTLQLDGIVHGGLTVNGRVNVQGGSADQLFISSGGLAVVGGGTCSLYLVQIAAGGRFELTAGTMVTVQNFFFSDGEFAFELGPDSKTVVQGQVRVTGTFDGENPLGYQYPAGSIQYLIINDGTDPVVGTFSGLPEGSPVSFDGGQYTITYTANSEGMGPGNDVALIAAAPEPNSAILLLAGLGGLFGRGRRRT